MPAAQIRPVNALPRFAPIHQKISVEDSASTTKVPASTPANPAVVPEQPNRFTAARDVGKASLFCHDRLRNLPFFRDRNPDFVTQLLDDVTVEVYQPGEVIISAGTNGSTMYILSRGTVDILVGDHVVCNLGDGAIFGEIALLGVSSKRTATVRASCFCDCRVVHRDRFQRLLQGFPDELKYWKEVAVRKCEELKTKAPTKGRNLRKIRGRSSSLSSIPQVEVDQKVLADNIAQKLRARRRSLETPCAVGNTPGAPRRKSILLPPVQPAAMASTLVETARGRRGSMSSEDSSCKVRILSHSSACKSPITSGCKSPTASDDESDLESVDGMSTRVPTDELVFDSGEEGPLISPRKDL